MKPVRILGLFLFSSLCCASAPGRAAEQKKEALVDQVKEAIDRGVKYLREVERGNGHWEVDFDSQGRNGGWTSLAMLALLNSGVKPDDPIIERGLKFLRNVPPESTYVVGLQTMVFAAAGRNEDREKIQRNVEWLIKTRVFQLNQFVGWGYGKGGFGGSDNSNTQYALLGLHEAHQAGAKIDREVWKSISDFYKFSQHPDGGWGYSTLLGNAGSTLTMSTAGLCGLLIAGQELNDKREKFLNGVAQNCGKYEENKNITKALTFIGQRFTVEQRQAIYYNLYGIERAGRLTGLRFIGNHDWYREGCEYLIRAQNPEGYWQSRGGHDSWKVVSTSFALLFLSKGRTPILISKLVHLPDDDWNNDRNDARNLVDYASKELFNKQPLAWQIFDAKRGILDNTREERLRLAGDLLQSPIAYFNGHKAPRFTPAEESVLKEYVDQGGFMFGEACCGQPAFDQGFRNLMTQLFPDNPLKPLPPEHPIWRTHALVNPADFKLEGIEMGCKTVVVYSPQDLSCLWESNNMKDGRAKEAFRLGGNIIAYATGMELPKPRLSQVEIVADEANPRAIPRGYLKVAQLRHEGDWQPAPKAMRNLMLDLQKKTGLLVSVKTEAVHPGQPEVLDHKFLYMHGRNPFSFADGPALDNLRANLQTGGILLADACCGKKAFDSAFRDFMAKLFPDKKLEPIPPEDLLFSEELNGPGNSLATVRCRRERPDGSTDPEFRNVPPALEGIKYKDRWIVIYSKYDLGCALENRPSSDCLGHDHESALRLGRAVVLYALRR
ncbi:MAG TPA: DUF4159 domain-containing protein [Gemmataceae bacterium]|nr:DUF4159 domain-containing protein [Gemmataceae bacterium]